MIRFPHIRPGSMVYFLLILQLGFFGLKLLLDWVAPGVVLMYGAMIPVFVWKFGFIWTLFTATFFHADFFHLFFNLFALIFFGPDLEERLGKFPLLWFFLGCSFMGYLTHLIFNFHSFTPVIGASGADFALLFAFGTLFPNGTLLLFFVLPVKTWHACVLFGLIELSGTMQAIPDGSAHLVHLGGGITGYLWIKFNFHTLPSRLWNYLAYRRKQKKRGRFTILPGGKKPD